MTSHSKPDGPPLRLARLRTLYEQAMDEPADRRDRWVAEQVTDVDESAALRRLLAAAERDGALDLPSGERAARIGFDPAAHAQGLIGQRIGAFRLVRLLGSGGMATVFLGEREGHDFRQLVAVKLLRRGLYSEIEQRLFRRERQALAALSHPNIAHLIDGGITDAGIPYIVLEYVDGANVVDYAIEHQLDLRARLRLFVVVCSAVAAAHRQLIVHRDIKPSNILVDGSGHVKLLDFGIAKLLGETEDGTTRSGMAAMTPGYAAPEQYSGGAISTATDVYALGVLLHELLLGERPQSSSTEPRKLSARVGELATDLWSLPMPRASLRSALRGDLDNIVVKALAVEAQQRYASAAELADDIERHLDAQPVKAHPPSNWYRTRKFVQRHRGGVATTVAFLLAIFAALGIALWQTHLAKAEAERANAMRGFILDAFAEAKPGTPRDEPLSIIEVVEHAIETARADAQMSPGVRIELLTQLGNVLRGQGRTAAALELSRGNHERAKAQLGDNDPITLASGRELVQCLYLKGELVEARALVDRLLALIPAGATALHARLLRDSARIATREANETRALADGRQALGFARDAGDVSELSATLFEFGNLQLSMGDVEGAIPTFTETLALRTDRLGARHVNVAAVHSALSRAYRRSGDLDRALQAAREALDISREVLPADHYRLGFQYNALAIVQFAQRDFTAALQAAGEALRINRAAHGATHAESINAMSWVGRIELQLGRPAAAVTTLREALRLSEARVGADHADSATLRAHLGAALAADGHRSDGQRELERAIASFDAATQDSAGRQPLAIEMLANVLLESGTATDALAVVDDLDRKLQAVPLGDGYWTGRVAALRARAWLLSGRAREASATFDAVEAQLSGARQADPLLRAEVAVGQAEAALALGDAQAATRVPRALERVDAVLHAPPALLQRASQLRAGQLVPDGSTP